MVIKPDDEPLRQINSEREIMKDWIVLAENIIIYGLGIGMFTIILLFLFARHVMGVC